MTRCIAILWIQLFAALASAKPSPLQDRIQTIYKPVILHSNERFENYVLQIADDFPVGRFAVEIDGQAENLYVSNITIIGRLVGDDPKNDAQELEPVEGGFRLDISASTSSDCKARHIQGPGFDIRRTSSLSKRGNNLANLESSENLSGMVLACGDGVCSGDIAGGNLRDDGIIVRSPMLFQNVHVWNVGGHSGSFEKLCSVGGQIYVDGWNAKGSWQFNAPGCYVASARLHNVGNHGSSPNAAALEFNSWATVGRTIIELRSHRTIKDSDGNSLDGNNIAIYFGPKSSGTRLLGVRMLKDAPGAIGLLVGANDISVNFLGAFTNPHIDYGSWPVVFKRTNGHGCEITGNFGNMRVADLSQASGLKNNIIDAKSSAASPIGFPDAIRNNRILFNGEKISSANK